MPSCMMHTMVPTTMKRGLANAFIFIDAIVLGVSTQAISQGLGDANWVAIYTTNSR